MYLAAVYDSTGDAERAREHLLRVGVASSQITISRSSTDDGIAAEWVGQSYENQPGQPDDGSGRERISHDRARYNEALRAGVCVLSIEVENNDPLQTLLDEITPMNPRSLWLVEADARRRLA